MSPKSPSNKSPLAPIDAASAEAGIHNEEEQKKSWLKRGAASTITGRVLRSSYETLRSTGTNVVCLSPWGDSSPLILPSIRFRDLLIQAVLVGTGGTASIAAPVTDPISDAVVSSFGDSILVEAVADLGTQLVTDVADDLFIEQPIENIADKLNKKDYQTTGVKVVQITLKHKNTQSDASIGFFRSSVHKDQTIFSSVKDYMSTEKGWFSPYLFSSSRRPVIPRATKPDIIFCHGPFMNGDYAIGQTLFEQSSIHVSFCDPPPPLNIPSSKKGSSGATHAKMSKLFGKGKPNSKADGTSEEASSDPTNKEAAVEEAITSHRRMVVTLVGIKPHVPGVWTSSARPGESMIRYAIMNGIPSIVLPIRFGSPLLAWHGHTLNQLWKLQPTPDDVEFQKTITILFEYLDLCVDWARVTLCVKGGRKGKVSEEEAKKGLKDALTFLLASAVASKECKDVVKTIDQERAGIAMWRIP